MPKRYACLKLLVDVLCPAYGYSSKFAVSVRKKLLPNPLALKLYSSIILNLIFYGETFYYLNLTP